jgi:PAS domain S-box-containing protein
MLFACPDGVIATDAEDNIVLYTGACESIFGFAPYEVLDRHVSMLFASEAEMYALGADLGRNGRVTDTEFQAVRKDAAPFPAAVSVAMLHNRYGEYLGAVGYVRDHSVVHGIEEELRSNNEQLATLVMELHHVAQHDALTGLLNRASAIEAAELEMLESGLAERSFGIVLFDLDHFKAVNDSYGHLVGDAVLASLAGVLRAGLLDSGGWIFTMLRKNAPFVPGRVNGSSPTSLAACVAMRARASGASFRAATTATRRR